MPAFATSYFGNRIVRYVQADMRRLATEGFGIVVHTFSEHDLRYYRAAMSRIVAASHDAGLEVWLDPWGLGGVFGGEAFSDVALKEPGWSQRSAGGARLPACCPSHPGFRGFVDEWIEASLAAGADAVFWDEPHLHAGDDGGSSGCWCSYCRAIAEDAGETDAAWRREVALSAFLLRACGRVAAGGGTNVVCLLPHDRPDGAVPWAPVARAPGVRGLGTVPFWVLRGEEPEPCVTRLARDVITTTSRLGISSHVWIQAFQVPRGREDEITVAIRAAASAGVDVIAAWGFDACESMPFLACARPEIAWRAVLAGIDEVRDGARG